MITMNSDNLRKQGQFMNDNLQMDNRKTIIHAKRNKPDWNES